MPRRLRALLLLAGALFALAAVLAPAASAHATLVASDPVNGSRLKTAPAAVTLTFDEAVGLGSIGYLHVVDSSGRRVDSGPAAHPGGDGHQVTSKLKAGLGDSTYTASFRVISADSHPIAGTVRFVVGNGVLGSGPSAASTVDGSVSFVLDVVHWLSYAALAVLGGTWVVLACWSGGRRERRARQLLWSGIGASAFAAIAETLVQGPYTAGSSLAHLFDRSLLDTTLHTDYGRYHCVRLLALGLIAMYLSWALQRERSRADLVVIPLGLTVAVSFSAVGHAATTSPHWLSISLDVLHVSAVSVWIGGLIMLVVAALPRGDEAALESVLPAVSRVSLAAVTVIGVTGTYAAWRGIGALDAVFTTTYGLLVVVKVVLFVALIAIAHVSRRVVLDRRTSARRAIRQSVAVEIVLALVVFGVTGALVSQPRGKEALAADHQRPTTVSAALGGGRSVTVTVDPGTHGTVTVSAELSTGSAPQRVAGTASLPSKQLGPIPLGLTANGTNIYAASGVQLPAAGTWVIELVVTTSEFAATTVDVKVHLY